MRLLCPLACLAACTFSSPHNTDDAQVDGSDGGEWVVVETFMVPANGGTVLSAMTLQAGVVYRLRASGTFPTALDTLGDAEYFDFDPGPAKDDATGIDVGLAVNDATVDAVRKPRWGGYSQAHVYQVDWTGDGNRITAQLHDGNYIFNSGELTLEILARK